MPQDLLSRLPDRTSIGIMDQSWRIELFGWLRATHGDALKVVIGDTRDPVAVDAAMLGATRVFHFAAQVAVTSSLNDPGFDFDVNAHGTFNVLEAVRRSPLQPPVIFTSTNKVYGGLDDVALGANVALAWDYEGHRAQDSPALQR